MRFREWGWVQWVVLVGGILLLVLLAVVIYVATQPQVFVPEPEQPGRPISGLPPIIEQPPTFPPSPVERIPLGQIQGLDTTTPPDLVARGSITAVSDITNFEVDHVSLDPSGNGLNYYDPSTSRFYRVDGNGVLTQVGSRVFADVETVVYAPNASDAVLEFPDGSNIVYNFDSDEQVTLPPHWKDFDFSPSSEQLAFKSIALDVNGRWLAVSDKSGNSTRRVAFLGENEEILNVDWAPNNQVVGTYSRPDGLENSELYFVGFNEENFPLSRVHGLKPEGRWNRTGNQFIYSSIHQETNFNPNLWVIDGPGNSLGKNRKRIPLQTWTDKCAFGNANNKLYCGVPTELPRGAGLIPSVANEVADNLYEVDLTTGVIKRLAIPSSELNVRQLTVSGDDSQLFIHDRFTNEIRRIQLEEQS